MSETCPKCKKCGMEYSIPGVYVENFDLCPSCRPIPICAFCEGTGMHVAWLGKDGRWKDCPDCRGTRHVEIVELPCIACGKTKHFTLDSKEANGVLNVFCNGECEDRYAARP